MGRPVEYKTMAKDRKVKMTFEDQYKCGMVSGMFLLGYLGLALLVALAVAVRKVYNA